MPHNFDRDRYEASSRRSTVYSAKGVVCCSQPLASEAGLSILRAGGNAADAIVAMAATLNVTEPVNCGVGGDAFALFWDAKAKTVRALNGSGRAAKDFNLAKAREFGLTGRKIPLDSVHAVTVPGAAAALVDIHAEFGSGKVSLSDVLAPAISLAEGGFAIHQMSSSEWREHEALLQRVAAEPQSGDNYPMLIDGHAPLPGQFFSNPALGKTLRSIGEHGKKGFYEGRVAEAIVQAITSRGGIMTLADLAAHTSDIVEPISYTYANDITVWECPPNGQGIAALIALGILDVLREDGIVNLDDIEEGSAAWYHTLIESIRLAFADVHAFVGDPKFVKVPVDELLSKEYLRKRAALFQPQKAVAQIHQGSPLPNGDTVYLCAADSEGNSISFIMSNFLGFGTAIVPNDCGFTLQSRGGAFSLDENSPNVLEGGKRPFHTIIPAMVTRGDELAMSYGVMGGCMQPQGQVQVLMNMLHKKRTPQLALDMKRFCVGGFNWAKHQEYWNESVAVEAGIPADVLAELEKMGHRIEVIGGRDSVLFGKGQAIVRTVDQRTGRRVWAAGTDYRGDGVALPQL